MNGMSMQNNKRSEYKIFNMQAANDLAPKASERIELVQRFRERNENRRRQDNLFGCVH